MNIGGHVEVAGSGEDGSWFALLVPLRRFRRGGAWESRMVGGRRRAIVCAGQE